MWFPGSRFMNCILTMVVLIIVSLFAAHGASAQETLTIGTPSRGGAQRINEVQYYQVNVPAGEHLFVRIEKGFYSRSSLYIRYGALPTTSQYDAADIQSYADQAVEIANTQAGIYYIMAVCLSFYGTGYEITADYPTTFPSLEANTLTYGFLQWNGDTRYYQFELTAPTNTLSVNVYKRLAAATSAYIRYGGLPTTTVYDAADVQTVNDHGGTITNPQPGFYYIMIICHNGITGVSWDIIIDIEGQNSAPVLAPIGNKTVFENELLQFQVTATDPEGQDLTFSADNLPDGAAFDPDTQIFTWTPGSDQVGVHSDIEFTVTESGASPLSDSETISIHVLSAGTGSSSEQWIRTYAGSDQDRARSIRQTFDGGYIVAGSTDSSGEGNTDYLVMKLDQSGEVVWQKTYGTGGSDEAAAIVQVDDDGDGAVDDAYIVAGISQQQLWIIKLSLAGDIIWQRLYDGTIITPPHIIQTMDGGYAVVSSTTSYHSIGGGPHGILLKLDPDGSIAWQRTYGVSGWNMAAYFHTIQQNGDGGYIVGGASATSLFKDLWMLKLDNLGLITWQKSYHLDNRQTRANAVYQTSDGGYLVAGATDIGSSAIWWKYSLLRLNSDGTVSWYKTYSEGEANSIAPASDGGFIVTGRTNPYDPATSTFKTQSHAIAVFEVDADGNMSWQRSYDRELSDVTYAVQQTAEGGYILAGETNNNASGAGEYDIIVLKLPDDGGIDQCDLMNPGEATAADETASVTDTNAEPVSSTLPAPASTANNSQDAFLQSYLWCIGGSFDATLSLQVPASATEGDGVLVDAGMVSISEAFGDELTVVLESSDESAATVPTTVMIPQGAISAAFDLTIIDDTAIDGTQAATITASATGFPSASDDIQVTDNEQQVLQLMVPGSASENAGTIQGTLSIPGTYGSDLSVSLNSSVTSKVVVPAAIIITAGQTAASFDMTVQDNSLYDGNHTVMITAAATGWTSAMETIEVLDNEQQVLSLSLPASVVEGDGTVQGTVSIPAAYGTDIVVTLISSDISELTVPADATIPAGQSSASFVLSIINDHIFDSTQNVTLGASAPGWTSDSAAIRVLDIDDTDEDALPDWWEILYFGGLAQDGNGDYDGDGVSNRDEYNDSSNPANDNPDQPFLSAPADGSTAASLAPVLEILPFRDPNSDRHRYTLWEIRDQSGPVFSVTSAKYLTELSIPLFILTPKTQYFWKVKVEDEMGARSQWSAEWEFTTGADSIQWQDRVPDSQALDPTDPDQNTLDLNGDGIADVNQPNVQNWKCLNAEVGGGQVGIDGSQNVDSIDLAMSLDPAGIPDIVNMPDIMPFGLLTFKLTVIDSNQPAMVKLYSTTDIPANARIYKYDAEQGWYPYPHAVIFRPANDYHYVELTLWDGGDGDANGLRDGTIIDPVGAGYQVSGGSSSGDGGGGGCFITSASNGL